MSNPPEEFLCPITCSIMRDPVVCSDGQTYDSLAIRKWLKQVSTSPVTGSRAKRVLYPNRNLKSLIESWKVENNFVDAPEPVAVAETKKKRRKRTRRSIEHYDDDNDCNPVGCIGVTIIILCLLWSFYLGTPFRCP